MKSIPMPPYSGGRWGAHSPSAFTLAWISERNALASARSASVTSLPRACQSSDSLGRIFSLTMRAVRSRMSLMSSLSPAIGVTLMGMVDPPVGLRPLSLGTLRRFGVPPRAGHPTAGQRPLVPATPDEADRPPGQRAEPVLEAGQEGDVHHQPEEPPDEPPDP